MTTPTEDEVFDALKLHPDLYVKIARRCALTLVDEWVNLGVPEHTQATRYLACTGRTARSFVAHVARQDGGKWVAKTGAESLKGQTFDTEAEAKAAADDSIRRLGYIVIDVPFNSVRRGPR